MKVGGEGRGAFCRASGGFGAKGQSLRRLRQPRSPLPRRRQRHHPDALALHETGTGPNTPTLYTKTLPAFLDVDMSPPVPKYLLKARPHSSLTPAPPLPPSPVPSPAPTSQSRGRGGAKQGERDVFARCRLSRGRGGRSIYSRKWTKSGAMQKGGSPRKSQESREPGGVVGRVAPSFPQTGANLRAGVIHKGGEGRGGC